METKSEYAYIYVYVALYTFKQCDITPVHTKASSQPIEVGLTMSLTI